MTTLLIVLVLLALGVGIVVWATRQKPDRPVSNAPGESDTAWNDPVTPATARGDLPPDDTASKI
jgi:hypothetical protein